ncbi:Oxygen sensor histidine kinase NreB [Limihaloglobus sulfuriphilus]|uniref:histidine kinase n=1 Tax=Limihaloglobus sulfuriphilus TaxID=1851148 RepID=A0A1Q2MAN2_9BACT|nr:PAS domain S-box protein [Limihaloglobus sulfuriphilus]AQQ69783.1 Oxygen sensor histidine kinase NreB [Limihaloglobus sulfuriphilus]
MTDNEKFKDDDKSSIPGSDGCGETCELLSENRQLSAANQQLRAAEQQLRSIEQELEKKNRDLRERVKELNCMYGLSKISEEAGNDIDKIFRSLTELIPQGFQYPDITAVRVIYGDKVFTSKNFKQTDWCISADLTKDCGKHGSLEVYYLKEMPACDEGPFLKEERKLLNSLASRVSIVAQNIINTLNLKDSDRQLRAVNQQLRSKNEQLIVEKNLFEEMFERAINCIAIYEPTADGKDFVFKGFNPSAQRTEGIDKEQVIGKRMTEVFPGVQDSSFFEASVKVLETGVPEYLPPFKYQDERISGWRESYIFKLSSGEIVTTYIDVTARIESYQQLKVANQQLRATEQQLRAANQQLVSSEQQLKASNQQLRAANQQLAANEQQLRAANQQLMAGEQQLRAANQQLVSSKRELQVSKQLFEELFRCTTNCIAIYKAVEDGNDFIVKDINLAVEKTEKLIRDEVIGRRVLEVFPGLADLGFRESLRHVYKTGTAEDIPPFKYKNPRLKGWGWRKNYLFKLPSGEVVASYSDITEKVNHERMLRESEERFRHAYERSPLGYQSLDKDGRILKANPAWSELTGYSIEQMRGELFVDLLSPESKEYFEQCFAAFKKDGEMVDKNFEIIRKDGRSVLVSIDGKIGHDRHGNFKQTHCILKDMTAQKQKEKEQEELNRELEERVKRRTAQLDRTNEKLHKLAFRFSMLEEQTKKKIAEQIHDDALQILVYLNMKFSDLLEYNTSEKYVKIVKRLEKETKDLIHRLRYMLFDLKTPMLTELGLAASIREWLKKEVEEKHGISTTFEDNGDVRILDEELRLILYRSVRELLTNVIKHAEANNVKVVKERLGDNVVITVEDDGKGFKKTIFEENDVSMGGFGLLSIEERLLQHDGKLEIEDLPGGGTRIVLQVPHR